MEEREIRLKEWVRVRVNSLLLACAMAAGAGAGADHLHVEDLYGWKGELARVMMLMKRDPWSPTAATPSDRPDRVDYAAMNEHFNNLGSPRLVLAREPYDAKHWQSCRPTDVKRDICEMTQDEAEALTKSGSESGVEDFAQLLGLHEKEAAIDRAVIRYRRHLTQDQYEMDDNARGLCQVKSAACVMCRILAHGSDRDHGS